MASMVPDFTRLAALVRLLSSDSDGEVLAAVAAIKRTLKATGSDIHSIADKLSAQTPKLSDEEMRKLYDAGFAAGRASVPPAPAQPLGGFKSVQDSHLTWVEIAEWCDERSSKLRGREVEFVADMTMRRYPLTEKQAKWLGSIYVRIGGDINDLPPS